jgi:anti-sigma-K factor RskA
MAHEEWLERGEIYALGALDGKERDSFEAHVAAGCSLCEELVRQTREALILMPRSLTPVIPPASIKNNLLRQLAPEPSSSTPVRSRPLRLWWGVGAGALAAAGLVLSLGWNLVSTRRELERTANRVVSLQAELAQREELVRFLADPRVRVVQLAGLPANPDAIARLLWNPEKGTGLFLATGLAQLPPGRIYELWAIAGNDPFPAGVFTLEPSGRAMLKLPRLPEGTKFDKFAVTDEPAGGVPKPTGAMHLLGSV